jgi:phosphatidylserine/phosphatidylglycerophosphate/cardiolipin synthase-like enzyme
MDHQRKGADVAVIFSYELNVKSFKLLRIAIKFNIAFFVLLLFVSNVVSASETFPARVTFLKNREYSNALLKGIRNSKKNVLLSFYLFKVTPSSSNLPGKIVNELIKAESRGVDVTVILEISEDPADMLNEENRRTATLLSRKGIMVQFDSPRRRSHMKIAMIDDHYVFIGSHNLTQSALRYNNETSVLIDSPEMASEVREYIKGLSGQRKDAGPGLNN